MIDLTSLPLGYQILIAVFLYTAGFFVITRTVKWFVKWWSDQ